MLDFKLRAVRQLAHDIVEHMGGHGGGTRLGDIGADGFDDLDIEIRRGQAYFPLAAWISTLDRMGMVLRRSTTLCT